MFSLFFQSSIKAAKALALSRAASGIYGGQVSMSTVGKIGNYVLLILKCPFISNIRMMLTVFMSRSKKLLWSDKLLVI